MMTNVNIKVVAISGSLRGDSYNRKTLQIAKRYAADTGACVEEIDIKEFNLPLYDGDIEATGFPESVQKLKFVVDSADIVLISTPEYNHSLSGALKNTIDWLSRGKNTLDGKAAAIFGASTGSFGTVRAQAHLRQILTALNVSMVPQPQVFIRSAKDAFTNDGHLKDVKLQNQLRELINKTIALAITNYKQIKGEHNE
jgi:chromate reductase